MMRAWAIGCGLVLAACGSVATTSDAAVASDAGPGSDAGPTGPDAAWPAQATVVVDGPLAVDDFCAPPGTFTATVSGPAGATLTLTMTLSDGAVATDWSGVVTLDSSGALELTTDVSALGNAGQMTLTLEVRDAFDRLSTDSHTADEVSGQIC